MLLLAEKCNRTKIHDQLKNSKYRYKYNNFADSYQTMSIGKSTITLNACMPELYEYIKSVEKSETMKHKPVQIIKANFDSQLPLITQNRAGSHKVECGMRGGRKHFDYVDDYVTTYNDCLCGKEWLQAHLNDQYPEPTIDITVDNGKEIHVNGNYKKGLIEDFLKTYTVMVKIGRKSVRMDNYIEVN